MNGAVVLFSGGQDSTTCLWWAMKRYARLHAVSIDYGQRHASELVAAKSIAALAGVTHEVLNLSVLHHLGGNALVDESRPINSNGTLPTTFVPFRNVLFLTVAAARAVQFGAHDVVCGACEADFSGYPDCRRSTMDAVEKALSLAVDGEVSVVTPLMSLTKAESVRLARTLPGCWDALAETVTCYEGRRPGCGRCPSCVLRARGFAEAGEKDPAEVIT